MIKKAKKASVPNDNIERRVSSRIATTGAGRDLDVLNQLGTFLAALGIVSSLLVLGSSPES